jgi:hypothetical protein
MIFNYYIFIVDLASLIGSKEDNIFFSIGCDSLWPRTRDGYAASSASARPSNIYQQINPSHLIDRGACSAAKSRAQNNRAWSGHAIYENRDSGPTCMQSYVRLIKFFNALSMEIDHGQGTMA